MKKYPKLVYALILAKGVALTGCGGADNDGDNSSSEASKWTEVWADEFEGDAIDPEKWEHEINCWGGGNNELQCYTADAGNSYVEDGMLHIVARYEPGTTGPATHQDDPNHNPGDTSATRDYTSARLRTKGLADWTYGRFEVRAKLPQGDGLWPAIWMLPTDYVYGGWPMSGEIDIMEAVNPNAAGGNEVHGTLHYGLAWPNNLHTGAVYTPEANVWEAFHTYAVEWQEGEIRWFVDDTHYATQTQEGWFTYYWGGQEVGYKVGEGAAPFDQAFHLLLNVAVGGDWPGAPDDSSVFPQEMVVDYVRVYECSVNPETGAGCDENVDSAVEPLPGTTAPDQKVFTLYKEGPATLTLDANGTTVQNTLVPGAWDGNNGEGEVASDAGFNTGDNTIWDLNVMMLPANAFLTSQDMSAVDGVNSGFQFTNMAETGELRFDLYVEAIEEATKLHVKLDSGWPNLSYRSIDIPTVGEWASVSVPFSLMQGFTSEWGSGQVNYGNVVNPFVVEPVGGTAHIKLDNIQVTCLGNCGIDPIAPLAHTFDIYANGAVSSTWDEPGIATYETAADHISWQSVTDTERPEADVLEVSFSDSGNGIFYFQDGTKDVTAFGNDGVVSFDIKLVDTGNSAGEFTLRADCVHPCSSGDVALAPIPAGTWQTVKVPVSTLVAGGLDLSKVNTPFVIAPKWEYQSGVIFRLDNVRWEISGASQVGGGVPENEVVTESFHVFDNALNSNWEGLNHGYYLGEGYKPTTIDMEIVEDSDPSRASAIQLTFGSGFGTWYVQSTREAKNLEAFSDGNLVFDIKVVEAGANAGDFKVKAEGGGSSSEIDFKVTTIGAWETKRIPVSNLNVPDLSDVNTPVSVWPFDGQQDGAVIRIDNVHWELANDAP